jgi:eukaryotic-like serine/threonine-protein kinase
MVCSYCGGSTPETGGFCMSCGRPISHGSATAGVLTPPAPITQPGMPGSTGSDDAAVTVFQRRRPAADGGLGVGESFGSRYHILRILGTGGMGAVYQAWDNELAVTVALKVIRPEGLQNRDEADDLERRFKRELLLARQVTHKNVVRIHDLGQINGIRYITMPYIEGADLATILRARGKLPVSRALTIIRQVVAGLAAAHEAGVVHRDLKPANIMITPEDQAIIMDFGIARSTSPTRDQTMAGSVVGTLEYMAPEQARGETVDHRADIYALGLILYYMLIGRKQPVGHDSAMTELLQRMQRAPASPRTIDPSIPEEIDRLTTTCLQPDPAARFQTTADLAVALARLDERGTAIDAAERTIIAKSESPTPPSKSVLLVHPWRWALGAVLTVSVVAGVWLEVRILRPTASAVNNAPAPSIQARKLIAVLPFTAPASGGTLAHVAAGIEEALSARLFQSKDVSLASGTAVERARALGSPERIGRELGVNLIVSGSVQSAGDRLQVDIALDDLSSRRRLWTQRYTGLAEDLLTLEDQIYQALLAALAITPASDELARIISHPTENFEAYDLYLKGRIAMRGQQDPKNVQSAITLFEQALAKDTGFALAYTGIADGALVMYRATRDAAWTARALSAAAQAVRLDDKLVEVHLTLGNVYQAIGRGAESIVELRTAVQLAPNSDDAYRRLGRAYLRAGRGADAIEAHQKAVAINPYYWLNHNSLGAALLEVGQYDKSIEANRRVIELEPENVNGHNDLGAAYLQTGRFTQAAEAFDKALKLQPTPETYSNLGIAYYYVGKFKESVPMFEKAVELNPNAEQWAGNLGDGYRWAGLPEKAASAYDAAIALAVKELRTNPRNAIARGNMGLYYVKKGDLVRGLRFLNDARAINRTNVDLIYEEAIAYALANRTTEALASLKAAFDAGYSVTLAANDPDLRSLKTDTRFAEILKQYSTKPAIR